MKIFKIYYACIVYFRNKIFNFVATKTIWRFLMEKHLKNYNLNITIQYENISVY